MAAGDSFPLAPAPRLKPPRQETAHAAACTLAAVAANWISPVLLPLPAAHHPAPSHRPPGLEIVRVATCTLTLTLSTQAQIDSTDNT
jgi:hypothetical protein